MIKAKVDTKTTELEIKGNAMEILTEVCCLVRSVYLSFKKNDEELAKMFETAFTEAIKDGMIFVTDDEITEKLKKITKASSKAREDAERLQELIDDMKKFLEDF